MKYAAHRQFKTLHEVSRAAGPQRHFTLNRHTVLPKLVRLYEASREDGFKARVAQTLYELSCSDFEGVSGALNAVMMARGGKQQCAGNPG